MSEGFEVFLTADAERINKARLDHLESLGLDLAGKRVLEVGGGIGLHASFFEKLGCTVVSTDAAPANVAEMRRRYPHRDCAVIDIDRECDLSALGTFDIVYCYGTLYHLARPDLALRQLAQVCTDAILVETVVSPAQCEALPLVREPLIPNQAIDGVGCRPTRQWVMAALNRHFGHAYTTVDQPDYPDFVQDWNVIEHGGNLRAVFVGSKKALINANLTDRLPSLHRGARHGRRRTIRIDVGAHRGEHSLSWAERDDNVVVHAFEPLPDVAADLASRAPPQYIVHGAAIGLNNGFAPLHVNRFDAASSLLPMDEEARRSWIGGERLEEICSILVQTIRLDTFLEEIGAKRVEFLKIDAQGGDFDVLRSAGDLLRLIDSVQLEVAVTRRQLYRGAADPETVISWMTERGFELVERELQSHGQEQNLTFNRIASDGDPELEEYPASVLFDLDEALAADGTLTRSGDCLDVTTPDVQWAYAIVVPRKPSPIITEPASLRIRCMSWAGTVEIAVLNSDNSEVLSSAMVAPGKERDIAMRLPSVRHCGQLVVRKASGEGPARLRLTLTSLVSEAEARMTIEPRYEQGEQGYSVTTPDAVNRPLYLIHQCGKVASQTVAGAISASAPKRASVERHHYLSPGSLVRLNAMARLPCAPVEASNIAEQASLAAKAARDLQSGEHQETWVLTGVREPISLIISAFFQNLNAYCPWVSYEPSSAAATAARIIDLFNAAFERSRSPVPSVSFPEALLRMKFDGPERWFEDEFIPFHELNRSDLFIGPGEDFRVFSRTGRRFLIYRTETLSASLPRLLQTIGLTPVSASPSNTAKGKEYAPLYDEFRRQFQPSAAMINQYRSGWYARAFGY